MTVYNWTPGNKGLQGTGLSILTWRNNRVLTTGDLSGGGTLRYLTAFNTDAGTNTAQNNSSAQRTFSYSPRAGTIRNFIVAHEAVSPVTVTYTLLVNGIATSIILTAGGTTPVADTTSTYAVAQGDGLQIQVSYASGTPSAANVYAQYTLTLT
jgi:hypothetical protein